MKNQPIRYCHGHNGRGYTIPAGFKRCRLCLQILPSSKFYISEKARTGECRKCHSTDTKRRRAESAAWLRREKNASLMRNFGLTLEEYEFMHRERNGLCDICGLQEHHTLRGKVKRLAVDHNHSTGRVRGLLCQDCNQAIGFFKDDVKRMRAAIRYLRSHQE